MQSVPYEQLYTGSLLPVPEKSQEPAKASFIKPSN